jgi:transcriptional regulator with XRE-family HTH domain
MHQHGQKIQESQVFGLVLARLIIQLRDKKGLSQAELAQRSGISQPVISRIEGGKQQPTAYQYGQLASAFGMDVPTFNAHVNEAMKRAKNAAAAATQTKAAEPAHAWNQAVVVAGVAGLIGLIAFAVAAALADDEKPESGPKPPQPSQSPSA